MAEDTPAYYKASKECYYLFGYLQDERVGVDGRNNSRLLT